MPHLPIQAIQRRPIPPGCAENVAPAQRDGYFPDSLTSSWVLPCSETEKPRNPYGYFLAGTPAPSDRAGPAPPPTLPGPLMINPQAAFPAAPADGLYDGTTYATPDMSTTRVTRRNSPDLYPGGDFAYTCSRAWCHEAGKIVVWTKRTAGTAITTLGTTLRDPLPCRVSRQARWLIAQRLPRQCTLRVPCRRYAAAA